jgi:hypothetical protein
LVSTESDNVVEEEDSDEETDKKADDGNMKKDTSATVPIMDSSPHVEKRKREKQRIGEFPLKK